MRDGTTASPWMALLCVGLAALGVAVTLLGARIPSPWLEHRLGPGITVAGAALWVGARWRARKN